MTPRRKRGTRGLNYAQANASRASTPEASTYSIIAAGTILVVGLGVVACLRRARN